MGLTEKLSQSGYVFLPAFEPKRPSDEVAESLGFPIALGDGSAVHPLRPAEKDDSTPNTYSGIYGRGTFPFHSDLANWRRPPRLLFLRAVVGYDAVPTLLIDGMKIAAGVGLRIMRRALVKPRRPVKGAMPLMRLCEEVGSDQLIRWDQTFIKPASAAGRLGFATFHAALVQTEPITVPLAAPGDTLIVDNWRMLHARGHVPDSCKDRLIERAYLEGVR